MPGNALSKVSIDANPCRVLPSFRPPSSSQSRNKRGWRGVELSMRAILMFLCLCVTPLRPQVAASFQAFLGSWRAVCADGKDFVIVVLEQNADASMGGSVQLANMSGGDDGSCAMVIDPPSEKHALKVGDGRLEGAYFSLRGLGSCILRCR